MYQPLQEKCSPAFQFGHRITRPLCGCCGGSVGIRKAKNRPNNSKPKRKDYRQHNQKRFIQED